MKLATLSLCMLSAAMMTQNVRGDDNVPVLTPQTCKQLSSVLINCACDSFLGAINGMVGDIFTHFNMTEIANSITQIADFFSEEKMTPVVTFTLQHSQTMCKNITAFNSCLLENKFDASNSMVDVYAKYFASSGGITNILDKLCATFNEMQKQVSCVAKTILPSTGCVMPGMTYLTQGLIRLNDSLPSFPSDLENLMCPYIGDVAKCISAQLYPCSDKISSNLVQMTQSASQSCTNKMAEGTKTPLSSVLVYCGLGIYPQILNVSVTATSYQAITPNIHLINAVCRLGPSYFPCVARELPGSKNPLDINLQEMLDFSQISSSIMTPFCDKREEMRKTIECAANASIEHQFNNCIQQITDPFTSINFTTEVFPGNTIRTELCSPVHNLTMCMLDVVNNSCSSEIATMGFKLVPELLRLDCGGSRVIPPTTPGDVGGVSKVTTTKTLLMIPFLVMHVFALL